ncbi:hypothetical protein [Herbiconiux daphne]|uniref:Iron ABC transporter ATP-binding protein n=1 Tax=Herbiconiux daphne TaxID=2970914 RepID=A0ABT2H4X8_9MICO|nr:hypothetical protein [Herbiconiux daphne]MCS5734992.1 hypothetical protein [Herbiconiux daphne]
MNAGPRAEIGHVMTAPAGPRRPAASVALLAGAGALLVALAGCASSPAPAATVTATVTVTATPAAPSPAPAPLPPVSPTGTALEYDCTSILDPTALDSLAPGFSPEAGYVPAAGSLAADVLVVDGTACGWLNADDDRLTVAIGEPDAASLASYEAAIAASSDPTSDFGRTVDGSGYFTVVNGVGDAEIFTSDGYWVSITGPQFAAPSDAGGVLSAVLQVLPTG